MKILQLVPVPENISTIMSVAQEDGSLRWEDTAKDGWVVLLALTDEEMVLPYLIEPNGYGDIDEDIHFRPACHCPKCGQKMWIVPHEDFSSPLRYECACGEQLTLPE